MAYTRKQVVTTVSIVYLVLVTALGSYASSRSNSLSVPIPSGLSGFTAALPIISGLILEGGYDLTRYREKKTNTPRGQTIRSPYIVVANTLIIVYSTVVITLLGTHTGISPDLRCGLDRRWNDMFSAKNADAIRAIQDAFRCCGLVNAHDKAWPFPDKNHPADACQKAFGRNKGCLANWRGEEERLAGILMGVVGLVFVWQLSIIVTPSKRPNWLNHVIPNRLKRSDHDEEEGIISNVRQAIGYRPYSDEPEAEEVGSDDGNTTQRAIEDTTQGIKDTANNAKSTIAGMVHNGDTAPPPENEWLRRDE